MGRNKDQRSHASLLAACHKLGRFGQHRSMNASFLRSAHRDGACRLRIPIVATNKSVHIRPRPPLTRGFERGKGGEQFTAGQAQE